jgi:cobalt-zinc-cadmium efflux system outer membrane protein
MRTSVCLLVLASMASALPGQQTVQGGALAPPIPETVVPPECATPVHPTAAHDSVTRDQPVCLSRSGAIALALAANPQIEIAGAQAQQARALKIAGVALPDPVGSVEWDGSPAPFGIGGQIDRIVGATITVPFIDKFRLNGRIGTAGIHQSEFDSVAVRQAIASQTAQTYDSLLSALRHHVNLIEADSLAQDFLRKTQARFDAGTVARLDVVNAQVAVAQERNAMIANTRDIANARASLNRLVGRPLGAPVLTSDSLTVPPALPDQGMLAAAALRNRPELASLQAQLTGARATTSLAREFWLPDFTLGVSKDYLVPSPGYFTTALSFPIPVLYWNHSRGEIAEDRFREQELDATYRDTRAAVGQDVRVAYATAQTALDQAVFIRDQLLPSARQAYRIAAASYGLGGSSELEVNAARAALLDAESQYTDALAAASSARADLERAIGASLASFGSGAAQ